MNVVSFVFVLSKSRMKSKCKWVVVFDKSRFLVVYEQLFIYSFMI